MKYTYILENVHLVFVRSQLLFDQIHFRFPKERTEEKKEKE